MNKDSIKISVIGVTVTGNMGGQAMLMSSIQNLRGLLGDVAFDLLSIYPDEDKKSNIIDVNVVPIDVRLLILCYLPLSLVLSPFRNNGFVRYLLLKNNYFKSLLTSDLLIDLGGIAFVDGRGLALLAYNVACTLPGTLLGVPTIKLSQAMGPFNNLFNRFLAKTTLKRCSYVIARGKKTFSHLKTLDLENTKMCYDTAFSLIPSEKEESKAKKLLSGFNFPEAPIIVSPSKVVEQMCLNVGIDLRKELLSFINSLIEKGKHVLLLPHSLRSEKGSKNNDLDLCNYLYENSTYKDAGVWMLPHQDNSLVLREVIGLGSIFIGCRFHSIVSSLSKEVPTIAISWGHKYHELVDPFDINEYIINYENLSADKLLKTYDKLESEKNVVKNSISNNLGKVVRSSDTNFELVRAVLEGEIHE